MLSSSPASSSSSNCTVTSCLLCERLHGESTIPRPFNNNKKTNNKNNNSCCDNNQRSRINENIFFDDNSNHQSITRTMRQCISNNLHNKKSRGSVRCASSVVRWLTIINNLKINKLLLSFFYFILLTNIITKTEAVDRSFRSLIPPTPLPINLTNSEDIQPNTKPKVCQSIDVRNSVTQLDVLKGCTVVEGFVQILLIDNAHESQFENYTFPNLIEITGYLALYRVSGLRSIGHLFPNLTVIRGSTLFINYALVVFEMQNLQEIGLHSLTDVLKGSVRFEKNPQLCYVDTIDWNAITRSESDNIISGNKPKNGCPVCERIKGCPSKKEKKSEYLCWNAQHCQKVCERQCGNLPCSPSGECCHSECIGGCSDLSPNTCYSCKNYLSSNGTTCVSECDANSYLYMERRCISKDECKSMKKPLEALPDIAEFPYKPFRNICDINCPVGYTENKTEICTQCSGQCQKKCPSINVDSVGKIQSLRGCTIIEGSLEIQIRGGKNIVKELEDCLSSIEVINGYLKIVRSFPIISLNFLRNLKEIKGELLENNKYILSVLDNQNLQELWNWQIRPPIKLGNANDTIRPKIFFHFNPKLCLQNIRDLRDKSNLSDFTDLEVAPNSNGDKVACNVTELYTIVTKRTSEAALIQWNAFEHHDPRSLLGYVVYFIEAPNRDVEMYDGRDACGNDGWHVDDVPNSSSEPYLIHILTQLKPYTQYAFYVKTYTISTERSGAQSKIQYFTTLPGIPSSPRALTTWSNSSNEMVITWLAPLRSNGNLTHYKIVGRLELDDPSFLAKRNYCDEPMSPEKKSILLLADEERKRAEAEKYIPKQTDTSCDCTDHEAKQSMREKEVASSIAFEDALHNQVYVKRVHNRRRKRFVENDIGNDGDHHHHNHKIESNIMHNTRCRRDVPSNLMINQTTTTTNVVDKIENGTYTVFTREIPANNFTFVMKQLRHYGAYNIELSACREAVVNESLPTCSPKGMRTYRTLPLESADDIPNGTFKFTLLGGNNSQQIVKLEWDEPVQPNGQIITYQIVYKRIDIENAQPTTVCITRYDFIISSKSYSLKDLPAGKYSIKIKATSLAGSGNYTLSQIFYINEVSTHNYILITVFSVIVILFIIFISGAYIIKRKYMPNVPSMRLIATVNPEYVSSLYVPDEWEMPRNKIELVRELGNGSFGMVWEGLAKDIDSLPDMKCAVKTVNETATDQERIDFLNEASVMKTFKTHHVVKLLGVVSIGQPTLVIMELMQYGDLKGYLRSHRADEADCTSEPPPTFHRILRMAVEIADGMAYLSAKKFVHRDLAARNCMVAADLTCKVGDFGMTRDIYETDYYRKGSKGLLPVRWMSPESLKDGVYTINSDVWSYGVVLWEIVTLASQPYQGLSNDQVLKYVIEGGVMEKPENCPERLYYIMRKTWDQRPSRRVTFCSIVSMLLSYENPDYEGFDKVSFYHCNDGIEARKANKLQQQQQQQQLQQQQQQQQQQLQPSIRR
ncbi:hypothetical protein HCN44_008531 [Aphidius gifuensis]|uniref:Tyrosine-protein kinase receptor n=2 Tax=Aphidius gifuensis TaxID=684658 RepID=A0A834XQL4_APHGI|nr:hypothetical protein HCN44_008531 [Aphidius gifuensis]